MRRIYKFSIIGCAFILTILIGNFVFAAGKGYFLENGNEVYIYDNLLVNGFLAVAKDNSEASGLSGDILVGADFNADINSTIYFCKSVNVTNDCPQKAMIWHGGPDFSLEAIDPNFYKIQTNKILGINSDLNLLAADGKEIGSSSPIKVTGCLAADGSSDCNQGGTCSTNTIGGQAGKSCGACPGGICESGICSVNTKGGLAGKACSECPGGFCNKGEVKSSIMYTDNLNSLNKFCSGGSKSGQICTQHSDCPGSGSVCMPIINLNPTMLTFEELNLGDGGIATLNNITLPDETGAQKTTAPQINLQNICYATALTTDCPSPANGAVVAPSTFIVGNSSWNFTSTLYPASFKGDDNKKICCNLSIVYPVTAAQ